MQENGIFQDSNELFEMPTQYYYFQVGFLDSINILLTTETNGIIFIIHIFQLHTSNGSIYAFLRMLLVDGALYKYYVPVQSSLVSRLYVV